MRSGKFGFLGSFAGGVSDGDPYWANVVSLLHFDGPDGSTTMTDEKGRIWTPGGNAQIDTAQSRWGGSSLLLDGAGDYLATPSDARLTLNRTDATIQGWVRPAVVKPLMALVVKRPGSSASEFAWWIASGKLYAIGWGTGGVTRVEITGATTLPLDEWSFVSLRVSGTNWRLYVGASLDAEGTASGDIAGNSELIYLGRDRTNSARDFSGHIDDFRWTAGIARTIEVPSGPFPAA